MSDEGKRTVFRLLGAGLVTIGVSRYFCTMTESAMSIVFLLVAVSAYVLLQRASLVERRVRGYGLLYGVLLSFALGFGRVLYAENSIRSLLTSWQTLKEALLITVGFSIGFGAAFALVLAFFSKYGAESKEQKNGKIRRLLCGKYGFLILVLVLLLAWMPCYLAYYPGVMSYDMYEAQSPGQLWQIAEDGRYNTFHPPIHTFLMDISLQLGTLLDFHGIRLYAAGQMCAMAMMFAVVLCYMIRKKFKNGLVLAVFLYFALHPVIAIFSFIPTKDVLLSGLFCLLSVQLHICLEDTEASVCRPWHMAALAFVMILCCLFRKNVIYALMLTAPFLLLAVKKRRVWLMGTLAAAFAGFFFVQNLLYPALGVKNDGSAEMFSVPMQQLANTYNNAKEPMTQQEKETLRYYISEENLLQYNPRLADPVKMGFHTKQYQKNTAGFWRLWFQVLGGHPVEYIDAFLTLNLPYWYPDANSVDEYAARDYIETSINRGAKYGFIRQSVFPSLLEFYESIADYSLLEKMPLIGKLCSISLPIWVVFFFCALLCCKEQYRYCCILLPCIFLWLTFMAGPVSNLRYILPILVQYPLLFAFALQPAAVEHGNADTLSEQALS